MNRVTMYSNVQIQVYFRVEMDTITKYKPKVTIWACSVYSVSLVLVPEPRFSPTV